MKPNEIPFTDLFNSMIVKPEWINEAKTAKAKIDVNKEIYEDVAKQVNEKMPYYFVGIVHLMEAGLDFTKHLHNGDPLTARTIQEPKGRPVNGEPPFTWKESAIDALKYEHFDEYHDWGIKDMLYRLQSYNGFGAEEFHNTLSAYLWSGSNHYTKGKYESDGQWNPELVSKQLGAAVILKEFVG